MGGRNTSVPMTRRYPDLKQKVLVRDSKIVKQIVTAWDVDKDKQKVLSIYLANITKLSDQRYWEVMRTVWVLCGSLENIGVFRLLMAKNRKHKYYFSTPEEQERLRGMDDVLTVYRACNDEKDGGISWTLSKQYAEEYKASFFKEKILQKTVNKSEIFALIERNQEEEIIIL